jgi:O-6-methylguanine DNA methyltransferase
MPMDLKSIKTEKDVTKALKNKTQFERNVYLATFRIPKGKVSTYKRIAEKIGKPKAYRAVANALHKNPLSPVVPCHRVVCSDGAFGGERKGAEWRRMKVKNEQRNLVLIHWQCCQWNTTNASILDNK